MFARYWSQPTNMKGAASLPSLDSMVEHKMMTSVGNFPGLSQHFEFPGVLQRWWKTWLKPAAVVYRWSVLRLDPICSNCVCEYSSTSVSLVCYWVQRWFLSAYSHLWSALLFERVVRDFWALLFAIVFRSERRYSQWKKPSISCKNQSVR